MKKLLCIILIITMLTISGCAGEPEIVNLPGSGEGDIPQSFSQEQQESFEASPAEAETNSGAVAPADESDSESQPLYSVSPLDAYDSYGYVHFLCEKTGTYRFEVQGDENLQWQVYILDSEFPDAERYIPQVYDLGLEGNGEITVNQGEYIYIYCNANSWTSLAPPENSSYNCYEAE